MRALKRLRVIADLIENADVVADIGCDHGFLAKLLLKERRAEKVIAIDISEQSLAKTEKLAQKFHLEDKIDLRCGDGFDPLKNNEANIAVIAGLGAHEIVKILNNKINMGVEEYIFQPANKSEILRRYLIENNFKIVRDFIVKDKNKFYNTIKAVVSDKKCDCSEEQILFGLTDFDLYSIDFMEYLDHFIEINEKIYEEEKIKSIEDKLVMARNLKKRLIKKDV